MQVQEERRKFVRLNLLVDIIYHRHQELKKEKISLIKNISTGGICLIVYEELNESEVLDLEIYPPEDTVPIKAVGRVVWVKEFIIGDPAKGRRFDVGIEFIKIDENDINRVNKYVFTHSTK